MFDFDFQSDKLHKFKRQLAVKRGNHLKITPVLNGSWRLASGKLEIFSFCYPVAFKKPEVIFRCIVKPDIPLLEIISRGGVSVLFSNWELVGGSLLVFHIERSKRIDQAYNEQAQWATSFLAGFIVAKVIKWYFLGEWRVVNL